MASIEDVVRGIETVMSVVDDHGDALAWLESERESARREASESDGAAKAGAERRAHALGLASQVVWMTEQRRAKLASR